MSRASSKRRAATTEEEDEDEEATDDPDVDVDVVGMDTRAEQASNQDQAEADFVVEKIVKARNLANGRREFLVKWQGYALDRKDWQPEENFKDCKALDVWEHKRKAQS